ncbi:HNH endonuclease [Nonomuraea sp. NPDC050556]|uniref:HNH endonuclease n=1 Tax=Nonomuraea sp. NPDC050556 TaxID=3364369 RepID=UPI0037B0EE66
MCAYCASPAEVIDHVDPLAVGGSHTAANVVPACSSCNLSKGDRLLIEWGGR